MKSKSLTVKTSVFCTLNEEKKLDFFIDMKINGKTESVYLFSTVYSSLPLFNEYKCGKSLDYVFANTRKFRQQHVRDHIIRNIKAIEHEYNVCILNKTSTSNKCTLKSISRTFSSNDKLFEDSAEIA